MVSTYGTVVHNNVPRPQCYSVPLCSVSRELLVAVIDLYTFFTSNLFLPSKPASTPALDALTAGAFDLAGAEGPASGISTSAMMVVEKEQRLQRSI